MRYLRFVLLLIATMVGSVTHAEVAAALPLRPSADIPLGGDTSRYDYASLDPSRHLLFIAHLGASEIVVFDTQARKIIKRIPDIDHVHGVLAIPELGRVYATATGNREVVAIDERSLAVTARIPGGVYPDGLAYAPGAQKLYVSDEHGGTDLVIDVRTNQKLRSIPLGGKVGNTQYDPVSKHIFVNAEGARQLAEIDPITDKVVATIDLPGAKGNHGLLIDPEQRLVFIACEDNARLLVLNLQTRKIMADVPVGEDPDVLAYDPALHWLYVAGEAGIVSIFEARNGKVHKMGEGLLGPDAHVVAVDPHTHLAYFPLRDVKGHPLLRVTRPVTQ